LATFSFSSFCFFTVCGNRGPFHVMMYIHSFVLFPPFSVNDTIASFWRCGAVLFFRSQWQWRLESQAKRYVFFLLPIVYPSAFVSFRFQTSRTLIILFSYLASCTSFIAIAPSVRSVKLV
jgi:hypothetical protein